MSLATDGQEAATVWGQSFRPAQEPVDGCHKALGTGDFSVSVRQRLSLLLSDPEMLRCLLAGEVVLLRARGFAPSIVR